MTHKNHCKKCGVGLPEFAWGSQPEFCKRCHPNSHWITPETLEKLRDVPTAYRKLVELDILDDLPMCGDLQIFRGDRLFYQRELFEVLGDNPHLQPFAKTAGGDTWCWTAFRRDGGEEPEILLIEDPRCVALYAPSFETFMYRAALDDAAEKPCFNVNEAAPRVAVMASFLRQVGRTDLAEDLNEVVKHAPASHGEAVPPLIDEAQFVSRLTHFLGKDYVDPAGYQGRIERRLSFLKTGRDDDNI